MGFICMDAGVKVRAALTTAITRKAINLSHVSAENASAIVGFMANDITKVYEGMLVRR
jgi:ATP-binding cassette, subfamily C (CFTR/MRP), member 1